jgi:hypothetical protein
MAGHNELLHTQTPGAGGESSKPYKKILQILQVRNFLQVSTFILQIYESFICNQKFYAYFNIK